MANHFPEPRPNQAKILEYQRGRMGVSAVPGSGKTWTLSLLAAKLVRETKLERGQQILVVTLVNSARGKFEQQVREFLGEDSLGTLYRVRTLHGLANDIVRERPGLVGLSEDFQIIDEIEAKEIIGEAITAWFNARKDFGVEEYLAPEHQNNQQSRVRWREEATDIASEFIKRAKDFRYKPEDLRAALESAPRQLLLAEMCVNIYEAYERGLRYRGAADFQDLIRLALTALETDSDYLEFLRRRWPIILEDEAQDSSKLQEEVLRRLSGVDGNWVRVGDPNQAIYETFTTANPKFLRGFLREPGVVSRELPESGRSAPRIIALANRLIEWSLNHPNQAIRDRVPLSPPLIQPVENGNPPDTPDSVQVLAGQKMTSDEERQFVAKSLKAWLKDHQESTVSLLLPTNATGAEMGKVLKKLEVPYVEVLRTTTSTRQVAGSLYRVVSFLTRPTESGALSEAFIAWMRDEREAPLANETAKLIKRIPRIEQYVAPREKDWLLDAISRDDAPIQYDLLEEFRVIAQRWQEAALLPIDQLILTIAGDIFREAAEIATAYSIAAYLGGFTEINPENRLDECADELKAIAMNQRKFAGLGEDDEQFDPSRYKGQAVVMTLHGAKGLEWDRVYLMSVNNYDYPSADAFDTFQSEKYFARNRLNLRAESQAQLKSLMNGERYAEGQATQDARIEYAAERLRLLYVGITRARRELIVTWNTGKSGELLPAKPLPYLSAIVTRRETTEQTEITEQTEMDLGNE
jgi:DNA helicase-2/ATP-dependent DNA helicase PcrA